MSVRVALTLLELLVCLVVILSMVALGAWGMVAINRKDRATAVAQLVQSALWRAQSLARRDQVASGLRVYQGQEVPGRAFGVALVQEVAPLVGGVWANVGEKRAVPGPPPWHMWVRGSASFAPKEHPGWRALWNFDPGTAPHALVDLGDILELHGRLYAIRGWSSARSHTLVGSIPWVGLVLDPQPDPTMPPTCDFCILRRPRRVPGEDLILLPEGAWLNLAGLPMNREGWWDCLFRPDGMLVNPRWVRLGVRTDAGDRLTVQVSPAGVVSVE